MKEIKNNISTLEEYWFYMVNKVNNKLYKQLENILYLDLEDELHFQIVNEINIK
jgi:hypothetical protein